MSSPKLRCLHLSLWGRRIIPRWVKIVRRSICDEILGMFPSSPKRRLRQFRGRDLLSCRTWAIFLTWKLQAHFTRLSMTFSGADRRNASAYLRFGRQKERLGGSTSGERRLILKIDFLHSRNE